MREWLGPDHPMVRQLLSKESPAELAQRVVLGTKLGDPAARMALWKGGAAAIAASTDPMIALARAIEPEARKLRKEMRRQGRGADGAGVREDREGALRGARHAACTRTPRSRCA